MNLPVRVAHASRVSGEGVLAIANFCCGFNDTKSLFRRDAETNTRDACATRSRWRRNVSISLIKMPGSCRRLDSAAVLHYQSP